MKGETLLVISNNLKKVTKLPKNAKDQLGKKIFTF